MMICKQASKQAMALLLPRPGYIHTTNSLIYLFCILLLVGCPQTRIKPVDQIVPAPYRFTFDVESHKVAFTSSGTYTRAVVETNKPAGDARAIEYTSSENAIATVNGAGVVTFVTQGTVTITATKTAKGEYAEATDSYTLYLTMKPMDRDTLMAEIKRAMDTHGNTVDLNYIDTSEITIMAYIFSDHPTHGKGLHTFNGNISKWDVSKVTDMALMFKGATSFNQDISEWEVGQVTDMNNMFRGATSFNQDISEWEVRQVTDMTNMFLHATRFTQNLNEWGQKIHEDIKAENWLKALEMFKGSGLASSLPSWCASGCRDRQ